MLSSYKVNILPEVYEKIMFWVDKSPVEISGFGKVSFVNGEPLVTSAYLVEQQNSSADTEIDAAALGKLIYETREEEGHLNFWWHSHVNMATFWSATDYQAMKQLGDNGWVLSIVFNKKEEYRAAIYQGGTDFYPPVLADNLDMKIGRPVEDAITKDWLAEYEAKCKTKTWANTGSGSNFYKGRRWCFDTKKWIEAQPVGKPQASLVSTDSQTQTGKDYTGSTGTTISLTEDELRPRLPHIVYESDGEMEVKKLTVAEQLDWAEEYFNMEGEWADEWYDLDWFYNVYKDVFVKQ